VWETLYADVVHPNDTGHIRASELLIALLNDVNAKPESSATASQADLPAPMITDLFANCRYAQGTDLKPTQNIGWTQNADHTKWESPAFADGSIEFGFAGKLLFVGYDIDKDSEAFATFSIDEKQSQPIAARRGPARRPAPRAHRIRRQQGSSGLCVQGEDLVRRCRRGARIDTTDEKHFHPPLSPPRLGTARGGAGSCGDPAARADTESAR
jgi:hypothetical protein